jgi:2-aminoadipate transaminase
MINFAKGHPNMGLLPLEGVQEAMKQAASPADQENLRRALNYPKCDRGNPELLTEISGFLKRHTKNDDVACEPSGDNIIPSATTETDLFITHGVSHGLDILCTAQTKAGDVVLMERPTYFLVKEIFTSHGLIVNSLPMKSLGGVDVDRLETLLNNGELEPPRMIYIIPTHQNPTARTMPINDRWKLVQIASRFGIIVAADEVYHLLDWSDAASGDPRPARMAVLDSRISVNNPVSKPGCCVSVSSFTKIFAPGVRCGWIEGPKDVIESLVNVGYIRSQGGCAPFLGEILRIALAKGISDKVLDHLNESYKERCELLCDILKTEPGIQIDTVPRGGYFLWISFAGIVDAVVFSEYCEGMGLQFLPGSRCDPLKDGIGETMSGLPMDACLHWARLCFADLDTADLERGAHLLISCYREYISRDVKENPETLGSQTQFSGK